MKTKLLISALASVAMLIGGTSTATAQRVHRSDRGGYKHNIERRFDNRHFDRNHGPRHFDKRFGRVHRPIMGTRFINRPAYGRFITHNRERLLLADGVLYKMIRTRNGLVYVVVGYL